MLNALKKSTKRVAGIAAAASVMATNAVYAAPGFGEFNGGNMSGDSVVKGFAKFFKVLGTYGGALYLIGAVFSLVLAVRNEDTEGRNKAILNMLAAIALLSIGGVLTFFNIASD